MRHPPLPSYSQTQNHDKDNKMFGGENTMEVSQTDEPPLKITRHEADCQNCESQESIRCKDSNRQTVFIRCAKIHTRGELVNGFLYEYRHTLGINAWYTVTGDDSTPGAIKSLRPDAPLECVYVKNSRKPYFLLECTEKADDAGEVIKRLLTLHTTIYEDYPVHVEMAKGGISVAEERKKLEKRDAARRELARSVFSGEDVRSGLSTVTSFVPRVLRRK